jgi:hypothetical protein
MPYLIPNFISQTHAIISDVFGEALGIPMMVPVPRGWVRRLHPCEACRNLNHCLSDRYRDRIEIRTIGSEAKSLGFKWYRPSTRERIVHRGEFAAAAPPDFRSGSLEHFFICGVLPKNQLLHYSEEAMPLCIYRCLCRELIRQA